MQKEIEKIFVDLIQKSLNLPDNYGTDADGNVIPCVTIRAQNIKLFNTPHIQITVQTVSSQVYACNKEYFQVVTQDKNGEDLTTFYERVKLNDQRAMQIDVYSRNNEARQRFPEVQMALGSTLAEQMACKYQFRIGKISSSFNTSGLEGGSDINRFSIRFNCISWDEKVTQIDYYDTFRTQGYTNKEKIADFTITRVNPLAYLSFPDYETIQSGEYKPKTGGFSTYENFTDNDGGFLTYGLIKNQKQIIHNN